MPDTADPSTTDDTGDSSPDSGDTDPVDTGDLDTGAFEEDGATWTEGPELPDCASQEGTSDSVALSGVLLTADGPEAGVAVYDRSTGLLTCVGADCDTTDATVVCTEGVISPGLVDTHNHLQYNVIPPWQHDELFEDRYDWRSDGDYWDYRTAYDDIEDAYTCEIMKWAELRALVGGATAAVGSSGGSCIEVLVRNLDEDEDDHGFEDYELYYSASTVTSAFDE
ncbi:MAG: hypothetical protein QGG40_21560, partial [Myxococcota bacterium]|nr:hypothetical protein [Myxococcota bacterium]